MEEAEVLMLESYCEKAQLLDGMDILDLGCGNTLFFEHGNHVHALITGWGSLSLYLGQVRP